MTHHRAITLVAACCLLLAQAPAWGQSAKITVAYIPNVDFVPLFIAQDKGYFAKHGLEATLTPIPIPTNVPAALTSGSVDVGPTTLPTLMLTAENGLGLVAVSGYTRNLATVPLTSLMIRKGMDYHGPADLKGKRVGMPGLLSAFDLHFRTWLRLHDVAVDQVPLVDTPFPPMIDMLKTGTLDGAVAIEPFRSAIVKADAGVRAADFLGEVSKDDAGLVWAAKAEWANSHAKERAALVAALKQGVDDLASDQPGAMAIEQKYLKYAVPVPNDYGFALTTADLTFYQDMMLKVGFMHQPLDTATLLAQ